MAYPYLRPQILRKFQFKGVSWSLQRTHRCMVPFRRGNAIHCKWRVQVRGGSMYGRLNGHGLPIPAPTDSAQVPVPYQNFQQSTKKFTVTHKGVSWSLQRTHRCMVPFRRGNAIHCKWRGKRPRYTPCQGPWLVATIQQNGRAWQLQTPPRTWTLHFS
jgi:hypothetical protein